LKLEGRILHLFDDPEALRAQLRGAEVAGGEREYVYGVNTDAMISGEACTLGYTPEVLGPHFLEDFKEVVREGAVRAGGFQVIVGGHAYGSGSSREVAVVAHRGAGIELVVADSFQRIFQENMVYSGMPFTTDRSVLERLQSAETAFKDGRLQESLKLYAALAPDLDHSPHFYSRWGLVASRVGQWELSNRCNRACLALDPRVRDARLNLGVGLLKTGSPQKAVHEFERLLSEDPDHVEAQLYVGLVKRDYLEDLDGALPHLLRFLKLAPHHPQAEEVRLSLAAIGITP